MCSMNCYHTAVQRKAFDRSWKRSVPVETLLALGDSLRGAFHMAVEEMAVEEIAVEEIAVREIDMKESLVVGIAPDDLTPRKG